MKLNRDVIETMIGSSPSPENADELINQQYGFKTIREKIAFLQGMFDIRVVDQSEDITDEYLYFSMLTLILMINGDNNESE